VSTLRQPIVNECSKNTTRCKYFWFLPNENPMPNSYATALYCRPDYRDLRILKSTPCYCKITSNICRLHDQRETVLRRFNDRQNNLHMCRFSSHTSHVKFQWIKFWAVIKLYNSVAYLVQVLWLSRVVGSGHVIAFF